MVFSNKLNINKFSNYGDDYIKSDDINDDIFVHFSTPEECSNFLNFNKTIKWEHKCCGEKGVKLLNVTNSEVSKLKLKWRRHKLELIKQKAIEAERRKKAVLTIENYYLRLCLMNPRHQIGIRKFNRECEELGCYN